MRRRHLLVVGVACVALLVSCSAAREPILVSSVDADEPANETSNSTDDTATSVVDDVVPERPRVAPESTDSFAVRDITWSVLEPGVDEGWLEVPLRYDEPDGDMISVYVVRHRATDTSKRIGSLLVNPGGPGFGGSYLALYADQIYDPELLSAFDIVGWDPRGTGESNPSIDCIADYDPFFAEIDITPDSIDEQNELVARAQEFADRCVDNGEIVNYVGTNNAARDMDVLRRALGEQTISYFGFSYGSELGATWATLFPTTVRAAVLDGAADPDADALQSTLQQLEGFERALDTFLARCSADNQCALHNGGDAEGAFDALMASLDESPVPTVSGRPPANLAVAINAVIEAMYSEYYWPDLEQALDAAAKGRGAQLLELHDSYFQRQADGTYGNELEAFQTITCADTIDRASVDDENALVTEYRSVAPRLVPEGSLGSYFCTFFPAPVDPRVSITGDGAGPIVVIGTTGDPATPLASTEAMANALEDGRLVIVEADQHTGYGVNRCVVDVVNDYLIDLVPPDSGTECR